MSKWRLDPKLLDKLAEKIGKTKKYIRERIAKRASKYNVSSEAYFAYWLGQEKIGAARYRRYLSTEIKNEIRALQNILSKQVVAPLSSTQKRRIQKIERVFQVKKLKIRQKPPLLSKTIIDWAKKNSEVYPALFIFENSLRNLIIIVLSKKYGQNWWKKAKVNKKIRNNVSRRMQEERMNAWRGNRGAEPIFYTDFSDLATILRSNATVFNPILKGVVGGLNFLTHRLDELAGIRHNLAHTSPLKSKDKKLLLLYFQNFYDLLDTLNRRINNL